MSIRLFLVLLITIAVLAVVACGGGEERSTTATEETSTTATTEAVLESGPYLRLRPGIGVVGILVVDDKEGRAGGYGFSFDNSEVVQGLPEGYFLPRKVEIYSIPTDANPRIQIYRIILGPGLMPRTPDSVVHVTLSEEFWIGPLKPGLTQVLFR